VKQLHTFVLMILTIFFLINGCVGPLVPVIKIKDQSSDVIDSAKKLRVYTLGMQYPKIETNLGQIKSYSCKNQSYDPTPSEENATLQLQIMALRRMADGVVNVDFSRGGTSLETNCWSLITATGLAVVFSKKIENKIEPINDTSFKETIVIPVSSIGDVSDTRKQILQNTLTDELKKHFRIVPQEKYEQVLEQVFQELEYEECSEDSCIIRVQEMLQVENVFNLQIIGEGKDSQLNLKWITLDEKKNEEDYCEGCGTKELRDMIGGLVEKLIVNQK
jgi:hypothetical protein